MFKIYLTIILLFVLTHCGAPGTALLRPVYTGVTTKSLAQASLSFGTNQIVSKIQETTQKSKKNVKKIVKKIEDFELKSKHKNFFNFHN